MYSMKTISCIDMITFCCATKGAMSSPYMFQWWTDTRKGNEKDVSTTADRAVFCSRFPAAQTQLIAAVSVSWLVWVLWPSDVCLYCAQISKGWGTTWSLHLWPRPSLLTLSPDRSLLSHVYMFTGRADNDKANYCYSFIQGPWWSPGSIRDSMT